MLSDLDSVELVDFLRCHDSLARIMTDLRDTLGYQFTSDVVSSNIQSGVRVSDSWIRVENDHIQWAYCLWPRITVIIT